MVKEIESSPPYIKPFSFYCGNKSLVSFIAYHVPLNSQIVIRSSKDLCNKIQKKIRSLLYAAQTLNVILTSISDIYNVTKKPHMLYSFMSVDYRNIT
jgi:hypothetical protein